MFSPRDLELLEVVGDVMRQRIGEVRETYERQIEALTAKVAALEARPVADPGNLFASLDHALTDKVAALQKALEPPPAPEPPDLAPLLERLAALESVSPPPVVDYETLFARLRALEEREVPVPPDLAPLTTKLAELDTRPTDQDVLRLAAGALDSTKAALLAQLEASLEARFRALPVPEKGDPGPGVTAEDFRPLFEAEYAKFALETERRIMDLVQRTLDKIPLPKDGKPGSDGVGFDDLRISRDGRTVRHEYLREGEVVKTFEFKTDELLYRGIYRPRQAYDPGDAVTWDGKVFVAKAETSSAPIFNGRQTDDWTLAVKDGRRGRDAYDIAVARGFQGTEDAWLASLKGAPGPPGKPGKPLDGWKGTPEAPP